MSDVNPTGWPRPRLPYRSPDGMTTLPAPWIARLWFGKEVDPSGFEHDRLELMEKHWLCQVCGSACESTAYAPVQPDDFHAGDVSEYKHVRQDFYEVSGGPVCSLRCIRLALTFCPHFDPLDTRVIRFRRCNTEFVHPGEGMAGTAVAVLWWVFEPVAFPVRRERVGIS